MFFHTQQVRLNVDDATHDLIAFQSQAANNLYNSVLYHVRQEHFAENRVWEELVDSDGAPRYRRKLTKMKASYSRLCALFKDDPNYKILGGQCAQQTIKSVCEAVSSFNELVKLYFKEGGQRPRRPGYRKPGGLAPVAFPAQGVRCDTVTGEVRLSMSVDNKSHAKEIGLTEVCVNGGSGFDPKNLAEVRIIPKLGQFYVEYVVRQPHLPDGATCNLALDHTQALGIDHGRDNWLTCVSTLGKSFIIDGRRLKSRNQWFNKRVASLKEGQPQAYWDAELDRVTTRRNNQVRDAVNKAARLVINHCLANRIGKVVFGWNTGQKDGSNMGRLQNQQFVQIPTGKLKERIRQLCEESGIEFVETEEAYTSKASFLDGDLLPRHGEKPSQYEFSGKRVKRGMYRTSNGEMVNADCNGAANIIRKVATQLGISLAKVGRGALNLPKRYDVFSGLSTLYRGVAETSLECVSAL